MFCPKPGSRLEVHVLKTHGASNLNRDDSGKPKTAIIGGRRRLRISSQAEKYSTRHCTIFQQFLEHANKQYGALPMVRTRKVASQVKQIALERIALTGGKPEKYEAQIDTALKTLPSLFSKKSQGNSDEPADTQTIAFSQAEINYLVDALLKIDKSKEIKINDVAPAIKKIYTERASFGDLSPEIQLFGRFSTSSEFLTNINTPLQVKQACTVHESVIERDYWTAIDDLLQDSGQRGSSHLDSRYYGSGVFYHYYCLDVPLLGDNICKAFSDLDKDKQVELTQDLISAFLYATLCRNPIGSQTNYANHDMPDSVLLTYGNTFPYSADAAFERPVETGWQGGYQAEAIKRLKAWQYERKKRYGFFCGPEKSLGLGLDSDTDLKSLVEWAVQEATPAIRLVTMQ